MVAAKRPGPAPRARFESDMRSTRRPEFPLMLSGHAQLAPYLPAVTSQPNYPNNQQSPLSAPAFTTGGHTYPHSNSQHGGQHG